MKNHDLSHAIDTGDLEKTSQLFKPSDLESSEYHGGSVLHYAVANGTVEVVRFLIEHGADLNKEAGDLSEMVPLAHAAESGNLDVVRYLIEGAGAEIDSVRFSNNPLVRAASSGAIEVVRYLVDKGVDPHLTYRVPSGVLINAYAFAKMYGEAEVVNFLGKLNCREPIEGEDIPVSEPSQERMMNHTYGQRQPQSRGHQKYQQVLGYMEERFGVADQEAMQEHVNAVDGMSVSVHVIQPNEQTPFWVLFTNGMSDLPMTVPDGQDDWKFAELVMYLPLDWIHPREAGSDLRWLWPIKWLRAMAYRPHRIDTWLGKPAAIVSNPEPLGPNTEQSCILLLPDLSELSAPLQTDDQQVIHFYTMVPIYSEERDIELQNGRSEFFDRFYQSKVPIVVDIDRPNFGSVQSS